MERFTDGLTGKFEGSVYWRDAPHGMGRWEAAARPITGWSMQPWTVCSVDCGHAKTDRDEVMQRAVEAINKCTTLGMVR